jgi:glycosyltransferase involved in cell wall biosynthesis
MKRDLPVSILMSVYNKDNPEWLEEAVDSMLNQTLPPSEFVIVKDGSVGYELDEVITGYEQAQPGLFRVIALPENVGLGLALKAGYECCSHDFIARIDADDISALNRLEKQLGVFERFPDLDVVGSLVDEFTGSPINLVARVVLPEHHDEIVKFAKKRIPVRHSSLLVKKYAITKAGGYRAYHYTEDYDLIVRMIQTGAKFHNIQEVIHYMRVSKDFYRRRSGWRYLKSVYRLKKGFRKSGLISQGEFLFSFWGHAAVILMPGFFRELVYKKFLRK